jgi:hypothetical protein
MQWSMPQIIVCLNALAACAPLSPVGDHRTTRASDATNVAAGYSCYAIAGQLDQLDQDRRRLEKWAASEKTAAPASIEVMFERAAGKQTESTESGLELKQIEREAKVYRAAAAEKGCKL